MKRLIIVFIIGLLMNNFAFASNSNMVCFVAYHKAAELEKKIRRYNN